MRYLKLPSDKEAYYSHVLPTNVFSLRITMVVGIVYVGFYLVLDKFRAEHFNYIIIFRSLQILVMALVLAASFSKKFSVRKYNFTSIFSTTALVILTFAIDYTAGMPVFFLSNTHFIILFAANSIMGYNLTIKLLQTLAILAVFVIYSIYFSPHSNFHQSQIVILSTIGVFSFVVGLLFERYKRLNFAYVKSLSNAKAKIEDLNQLKTKLISILSHDLNNPLNHLKGLMQLKKTNKISTEEWDHYFEKVDQSVNALSNLLKNLIHWSKNQMEGFTPHIEKVNLRETLEEELESLTETARLKGIGVDIHVADSAVLTTDKNILRLVARNLIANAIKFSNPGSIVSVNFQELKNTTVLSFTDQGIGMSPEQLRALFTTKSKSAKGTAQEAGSGIGLIISHDFVKMLGGKLEAISTLGKGSTFSISFPNLA